MIYKLHDFMNARGRFSDKSWAISKALFNNTDIVANIAQRECFGDVARRADLRGDKDLTLRAFKLGLPLDEHGGFWCNLGLFYRENGEADLAMKHFKRAADLGDGN